MTIHAPRGTLDILPADTAKWQYVEQVARDICGRFGYREIRTPLFEATELFARGIGEATDIVEKEMYTFLDKAERSITLRPEGTASVVRAFLEHNLGQILPVKVYYIGPVFRYERPQAGRYRQHHQMGIEALGSQDPSLDGETMSLAIRFYQALGLSNLQIRMNSIGCKVCKPRYREALRAYAQPRLETFCGECRRRLERNPLRILDCKVPACRELVREAPPNYSHLCGDCSAHFEGVKHYLEILSIPYVLDPLIVRGLDYYTRTVYEVTSESLGAQNSLCGGGRYDDLAEELGGKPTPA
ncbi:MAG: histidine--tRNA ligase, partial [Armatimonadetes bacterium]|nr:histidine--tRNA ligase [Armatimonadota bacterium]